MRKSGLEILGDIDWGTHFCQFYRSPQDLIDVLVPYFKQGLLDNEFCMWVTSDPLPAKQAKAALQAEVPELDELIAKEQIEILEYNQWYTAEGGFDAERVLNGWVEKLDQARGNGYEGLRLSGNTFWLEEAQWRDFTAYEERVDKILGKHRIIAFCTYSLDKCSSSDIIDVVNNHQFALIKREGKWESIESSQRRRAEKALQESEERVRVKLQSLLSPEGEIEQVELADMIDASALRSLLKNFYELAGIPVAIIDLKGKVLVGAGWQDICVNFHRANPESCRHCIESDTELSAGIPPGEFRLYGCKNNMWDGATPIIVGGKHVGNVFTGQFFFEGEEIDYELFRVQARRYGYDEEKYIAALDAVPRLSKERVERGIAFFRELAQMISRLSYSNIKLARSLAERDALTKSLRESQERLNRAQEIAHLGSWELNLVNSTLTWSDEVYRIFGLTPREFDASYESFLEAVHPDDRAAVDAAYAGSLREGRDTYEIEHRVVKRSTGEVRIVHEKCRHIRDESGRITRSVGMVHDITERKKAEESLIRAKEEWERTFDSVPDLIAILDNQHRIIRVNAPMAQRLGLEAEQCVGLPCYKYVHGLSAPPAFCPHSCTVEDGRQHIVEVHEDRLGGDFLVSTTPLRDEKGKMVGSVHVAHDITQRKKAEDRILSLNEELKQNLWKLEAANKELEAFSYSVSHDLRAPLRSIAGFSRVLSEDCAEKLDEEGRDALERILKATAKMGHLIDDMLNLSRVTRSEMQYETVNLSDIAGRIANRLCKEEPERNVNFSIAEGLIAYGDERLLQAALENLLGNAWKFTGKSERSEIEFTTEQQGGERVFLVRDNGVGFDMTYIDKLFNPFQRLHREEEFPGTGIGLATVRRVIKRHGGRVWIEGEVGKGATVYFTLGK